MTTAEYRERVGTTILDQLACTSGGAGQSRLRAMMKATDIKTLVAGELNSEEVPAGSPGVGFRFSGSKAWNGIEIYLNRENDIYSLRFYRMQLENAGTVLTLGEWVHSSYAGELESTFRGATGLDTHL